MLDRRVFLKSIAAAATAAVVPTSLPSLATGAQPLLAERKRKFRLTTSFVPEWKLLDLPMKKGMRCMAIKSYDRAKRNISFTSIVEGDFVNPSRFDIFRNFPSYNNQTFERIGPILLERDKITLMRDLRKEFRKEFGLEAAAGHIAHYSPGGMTKVRWTDDESVYYTYYMYLSMAVFG